MMAGYVLNPTLFHSNTVDQTQDLYDLNPGVHSQQYNIESNLASNKPLIVQSQSSDAYLNQYQQPSSSIKASLGPESGLADFARALDQPSYEPMGFFPIYNKFGNLPPTSYQTNLTNGMMGSNQATQPTLSVELDGAESASVSQSAPPEVRSEVSSPMSESDNSAHSHALPDGYVNIGHILSNGRNREDKYKCNQKSCGNIIFERLADLKRHHASRHRGSGRLNAHFWCPVPDCPRSRSGNNPFPRKDKMHAHIDKVHV